MPHLGKLVASTSVVASDKLKQLCESRVIQTFISTLLEVCEPWMLIFFKTAMFHSEKSQQYTEITRNQIYVSLIKNKVYTCVFYIDKR